MAMLVRRGVSLWHRGLITEFITAHQLLWDLGMGCLTVAYVVLAFQEPSGPAWHEYVIWALSLVFLVEFGVRCYDSPDRANYLRRHWLDLVTAVPVPGIPGLRVLRLLRLLRFVQVGTLLRSILVRRGWQDTGLIWPTLVLFWIGSASALWLVEHDVPGSHITNFSDAMTAALEDASTLGIGNHAVPVTQEGQMIAAGIVFFALGLWGFASSRLTQIWLSSRQLTQDADLASVRKELEHVYALLETVASHVLEATPDRPGGNRSDLSQVALGTSSETNQN